MKSFNFFKTIIFTLITFLMVSCSQNENIDDAVLNPIPDLNNPATDFFKVNFGGATYKATTFGAIKSGNKFLIFGAKGTIGENIAMTINGTTPGLYKTASDVIVYNKSDLTEYDYVSFLLFGTTTTHTAEITITAVNTTTKRISGTFDFVGYWSNFNAGATVPPINFTNGSFEMPYTEEVVNTNSFFAKINGAEFEDTLIATAVADAGGSSWLSINANNAAQNRIVVSMKNDIAVGTFNLSNPLTDLVRLRYVVGNDSFVATNGSVIVTTKTATTAKGTFQFIINNTTTGLPLYTVTEGSFDVIY